MKLDFVFGLTKWSIHISDIDSPEVNIFKRITEEFHLKSLSKMSRRKKDASSLRIQNHVLRGPLYLHPNIIIASDHTIRKVRPCTLQFLSATTNWFVCKLLLSCIFICSLFIKKDDNIYCLNYTRISKWNICADKNCRVAWKKHEHGNVFF